MRRERLGYIQRRGISSKGRILLGLVARGVAGCRIVVRGGACEVTRRGAGMREVEVAVVVARQIIMCRGGRSQRGNVMSDPGQGAGQWMFVVVVVIRTPPIEYRSSSGQRR